MFHAAKETLCDEGDAWCWMGCMPLANGGYCPSGDQMVCFSSVNNKYCNTEPDDPFPVMDGHCKWQCQATK